MTPILSSHALWTVARVELKTLLRSWVFRIFAGIIFGILIFLNIVFFSRLTGAQWMFRAVGASIPYANVLYLNLFQTVVAVFLASDFLKRDRRLDSTEVVYVRSMSNADYIVGKTIGILLVFLGLDAAVCILALVFNLVFSGGPVVWRVYLYYPLLISLPSLVYVIGLSFILMAIIGNQAVTLILLLGYSGTVLFYLGPRVSVLADFLAFHLPLLYSGFVGFGSTGEMLMQRGIYLFLGLAGILGSISLLKRLPQSAGAVRLSRVLAFALLAAAVALGGLSAARIAGAGRLRDGMRALDDRFADAPRVEMQRCSIECRHEGSAIECAASIVVHNGTAETIPRYRFYLNPALAVTSVERGGAPLEAARKLHAVDVSPPLPLPPGGVDSLLIRYGGRIDEAACYLDIDEKELRSVARLAFYPVERRFGFITPGYVLLTPEALWYPTPCVPFAPGRPAEHDEEFTAFTLDIATQKGLTALSQGPVDARGGGRFVFAPETPLGGLTVCIGPYETHAVTVDSVTYVLALHEGHDAFTPYFAAVRDSLPAMIREIREDYERRIDLSYPFPRLTLVEVPIQFNGLPRRWTIRQETVQPEMILLPERGAVFPVADFGRSGDGPRRRGRRANEQMTPRERQARQFTIFCNTAISGTIQSERGGRRNIDFMSANYNVFPNYFTLVNHLRSPRLPILGTALESFILSRIKQPANPALRSYIGLTDQERANLALRDRSLADILADDERRDIQREVLEAKGEFLFVMLQERIGEDLFRRYLADLIEINRFRVIEAGALIEDVRRRFGFDLEPCLERWYRDVALPGYLTGAAASYQVMDGERTRFQVVLTASNTEPVDGFLRLSFRTGEGRRFFAGDAAGASVDRVVSLAANETKEIGVLLDFKPRLMAVNTLVSLNVPATLEVGFTDFELNERATPFDGERLLDTPLGFDEPGVIIVDNEDEGFQAPGRPSRRLPGLKLRKSARRPEERYEGIRFWRPPGNRWVPAVHSDFFGRYVRSALYTKGADGELRAAWRAAIPASGAYDVYYYVSMLRRPWGRGEEHLGQYHFEIAHDDGVDEVVLDIDGVSPGWNFLGSYYVSAGDARVVLTNESTGLLVIADAVKWVKR